MMLDLLDQLLNKHVEIIMSMDFIVNHVVQYLCMYGLFHMQGMDYLFVCYCTGCLAYFEPIIRTSLYYLFYHM